MRQKSSVAAANVFRANARLENFNIPKNSSRFFFVLFLISHQLDLFIGSNMVTAPLNFKTQGQFD